MNWWTGISSTAVMPSLFRYFSAEGQVRAA